MKTGSIKFVMKDLDPSMEAVLREAILEHFENEELDEKHEWLLKDVSFDFQYKNPIKSGLSGAEDIIDDIVCSYKGKQVLTFHRIISLEDPPVIKSKWDRVKIPYTIH